MTRSSFPIDLNSAAAVEHWLTRLEVEDIVRAETNLRNILSVELPAAVVIRLGELLESGLKRSPDAGMALNNFDRFLDAFADRANATEQLIDNSDHVETLLRLFGSSQYFSDLLIIDPNRFEDLVATQGTAVRPAELRRQLSTLLDGHDDPTAAGQILRKFRHRQLLRIGYSDIIAGQPLEVIVDQISHLADVMVQAALNVTRKRLEEKLGIPRNRSGKRCQFVVLALGKLGGKELNYSSDIDLMYLYECEGKVDGRRGLSHQEFFARLGGDLAKLLSEHTESGLAYRVDLRLRPEGQRGPIARSVESASNYYDLQGRTWERQAFIKARAIAGDLTLGVQFLFRMDTWVYRRYLNFAEINGIKALKRRIESRTTSAGEDLLEVKTGRGGIRDVEFCTQFLQLLNGGDLPEVRTGSTLAALEKLAAVGCLTRQEYSILAETYQFLRKTEHRLQTMYDLQTHRLPADSREIQKLARRMGYVNTPEGTAGENFLGDYQLNARLNRTILNHLLHDAFPEDDKSSIEPEVDLILDPHPDQNVICESLGRYRFSNIDDAYRNLMLLARESIPFLSTPRCRHFLASIAPRLLHAISQTPDPDHTLINLANVSESLGGKAVLWELFSFNSPSLKLYVDLCSGSQFLTDILIRNPGMIDELMDSLVLNQPREYEELQRELHELCRGAEDPGPTLHGFKNTEMLRVGVRDVLGKNAPHDTLMSLSHIAEAILHEIADLELKKMLARWGQPVIAGGNRDGEDCRMAIVALGKLGGQELNYHSDLDVIFLYEADGMTDPNLAGAAATSNMHFFSELAQKIIRSTNATGPFGRLYEIDPRLRPTGRSGSIVMPLAEFSRYYESGEGQIWERQALTRARIVFGEPAFAAEVQEAIQHATYGPGWSPEHRQEIRSMRIRLEDSSTERDLKRGPGGLMDIEFLVQALQLQHGGTNQDIRHPNTWIALEKLASVGCLTQKQFSELRECYKFLRDVTKELRLMYNTSRARLPDDSDEVQKLALRLGYENQPGMSASDALLRDCSTTTSATRILFNELIPGDNR